MEIMERTKECKEEIEKYQAERDSLRKQAEETRENYYKNKGEKYEKWKWDNMLRRERAIYTKIQYRDEKISDLEGDNISNKEKRALIKEIYNLKQVEYDRSLGCRDYIREGFSKALGKKIRIKYTKFTSFMRNVKGCRSLAGQYDIIEIKELAK